LRILFDTNVWIAAFISRGVCTELFEYCMANHVLLCSEWIVREIENVLTKKFHFNTELANKVLDLVKESSEIISHSKLSESVCRDPDDDNILAAALAGKADCILTGDKDLLVLETHEGIPILKPAEFWKFEQDRFAT